MIRQIVPLFFTTILRVDLARRALDVLLRIISRSACKPSEILNDLVGRWREFPVIDFGPRAVQIAASNPCASAHLCSCRETPLHSSENRWKSPQLRRFRRQTGREKVSRRTPQPSFRAFFSVGHMRSPVSKAPSGECNAITNR